MPAIEDRHGEQVENGQVDIEQHQEVEGQPVICVHPDRQQGDDAHRPAQILRPDPGLLGVEQRVKDADCPVPHVRDHFPRLRPGFHHAIHHGRITCQADADPPDFFLRIDEAWRDAESQQFLVPLDYHLGRHSAAFSDEIDQLLLADHRNAAE